MRAKFLNIVAVFFAGIFAVSAMAADAKVEKVTFTNKLVGGKKTWVPSETTMPAGKVEITLVNELADPHGFELDGLLKVPLVVGGKETKTVMVDNAAAGTYKYSCQMHPAHVGGEITVK